MAGLIRLAVINLLLLAPALLFAVVLTPVALAATHARLPANNPVPGGIAVLYLDVISATAPTVRFGDRRIMVLGDQGKWTAVVGLASNLVPGNYILTVTSDSEVESTQRFLIKPLSAATAQRTMQLPDSLSELSFTPAVSLNSRELSRELWQYLVQPDFVFRPVVESKLLIPYGLLVNGNLAERFINHFYVTYFSPANALVYAPAAGIVERVLLTETAGTLIYISHGQGLTSILSHVGKTILKAGQQIKSGELIGVVEPILDQQNGRVDWGLLLNGALVDPLQFSPSS